MVEGVRIPVPAGADLMGPYPLKLPQFEDPRDELVRRLLEYRKYKGVAETLHEMEALRLGLWSRAPAKLETPEGEAEEADLSEVSLFDLLTFFKGALDRYRAQHPPSMEIEHQEFSIREKMEQMLARVKSGSGPVPRPRPGSRPAPTAVEPPRRSRTRRVRRRQPARTLGADRSLLSRLTTRPRRQLACGSPSGPTRTLGIACPAARKRTPSTPGTVCETMPASRRRKRSGGPTRVTTPSSTSTDQRP